MAGCPKCEKEHDRCTFGAGTLGCVNNPCANPHHNPRWVGVRASDEYERIVLASSPPFETGGETFGFAQLVELDESTLI